MKQNFYFQLIEITIFDLSTHLLKQKKNNLKFNLFILNILN